MDSVRWFSYATTGSSTIPKISEVKQEHIGEKKVKNLSRFYNNKRIYKTKNNNKEKRLFV